MSKQRDVELAPEPGASINAVGRNVLAVIGVDRYHHWPQLTNAVRDATGIIRLFRRVGFEEIAEPLLDERANGRAINELVTNKLTKLGPEDSLVLFYAGHGGTRRHRLGGQEINTGYLIPVDASDSPNEIVTWVELDGWLRAISLLPAKHILVILDACHSGIALDPVIKWRDGHSWREASLAALTARRSRRIITSALDDQVALDSGPVSGHSLFTGCLIEGLSGGISRECGAITTGSEVGLYVQRRVRTYPGSRQTPDFGSFDLDDRGEMAIPLALDRIGADPSLTYCDDNPLGGSVSASDAVRHSRRRIKLSAVGGLIAALVTVAIVINISVSTNHPITAVQIDANPEGARTAIVDAAPVLDGATTDGAFAGPCSGVDACQVACRGGAQAACVDFGKLLAKGEGIAKDVKEAHALFDTACKAGDGRGCSATGLDLLRGTGVLKNIDTARALLERSCDLEYAEGCEALAGIALHGEGVPKDGKRALELYAKACDLGGQSACMVQASMYMQAIGVEQDDVKAIAIYQRLCNAKHGDACGMLGRIYMEGRRVPRDEKRGVELLQSSCDYESGLGCALLGSAYANGAGVGGDRAQSKLMLSKACQHGYMGACERPKLSPKDSTPKDGTPKDDTPKDDTPKDDTPKDDTPKENASSDGAPKDGTPKDEIPKEGTSCGRYSSGKGVWCGGVCANTNISNEHCGECYNSCSYGWSCVRGGCRNLEWMQSQRARIEAERWGVTGRE